MFSNFGFLRRNAFSDECIFASQDCETIKTHVLEALKTEKIFNNLRYPAKSNNVMCGE